MVLMESWRFVLCAFVNLLKLHKRRQKRAQLSFTRNWKYYKPKTFIEHFNANTVFTLTRWPYQQDSEWIFDIFLKHSLKKHQFFLLLTHENYFPGSIIGTVFSRTHLAHLWFIMIHTYQTVRSCTCAAMLFWTLHWFFRLLFAGERGIWKMCRKDARTNRIRAP